MTWRRRATSSARGLRLGIGDWPCRRPHRLGKMSDRRGIDPVGLGQLASGAGKVADLAGIDHCERELRGTHRTGHHRLVATGRLHGDQSRSEPLQALHQHRQAFAVARHGKGFATWPQMHVQPIFRHIDPDKMLHVPSLRMRARLAAPATVRAEGTGGWGTVLSNGLIDPRSVRAPIRHRSTDFTTVRR